jgi:lipid II:glycine glycyltransferase (peptidoglycan interpeptide bridge formation enzyme)
MQLQTRAPAGWDSRVSFPILSEGFAEAARRLGYQPHFLEHARDRALLLLRSVPLPVARRWTLRAKAYVDRGDPDFLRALLDRLHGIGVAHVKLNDERHGLPDTTVWSWPRVEPVPRYVFLIDVAGRTDDELLRAMQDPVPRNIRKAQRAGVVVDEMKSEDDLRAFTALMDDTSDRMRARHVAAVYPAAFFIAAFHEMVPRGQALFLLARADGEPVAGQMYLVSRDKLTYYHGASTRARELTPKQGPTAAFWHAIRLARDRGIAVFDFGGANPTTDPADVHFSITEFKRRWGGRHVMIPCADVILSPAKVAFQDRCLKPFWDRAHTIYLRMFRTA